MDPQTMGLYGGIAGGAVGVLGGLAGTAVGVANTKGPREKSFVVRCAALLWAALAVTLAAAFVLMPAPLGSLAMLPLFLTMPWAIRAGTRRQERLRQEGTSPGRNGREV